jgi:branched-chain amino acid transport system permease protein
MDQFLQAVINGVTLGGFYGAMVLGFSVIWGVMGFINLAHGEFIMLGAYLAWILNTYYGWEPFLTPIVVLPVFFVLGYVLQRVLINRVVERPPLIGLLVAFGLGIIMASAVNLWASSWPARSISSHRPIPASPRRP